MAVTANDCINALIYVATQELGYLEKASKANLNDKTANAGKKNYTKYWEDVKPSYQGNAWCACFVSWIFLQVFGQEMAKKLLMHWPFVYCPTLGSKTTNRTPHKGDIILFWHGSAGRLGHTGYIISVTDTTITTIEGNTSAGSTVIPNGGGVHKKTYQRSKLNANNKYFRPNYALVTKLLISAPVNKSATTAEVTTTTATTIGTAVALTNMNVRTTNSTSGTYIGCIAKGTTVNVLGVTTNGWLKIAYTKAANGEAYVCMQNTAGDGSYFNLTMNSTKTGTVKVSSYLNIRHTASTSAKVRGKLVNGDTVTVLANLGSWLFVKAKGVYGYVSSTYVKQ